MSESGKAADTKTSSKLRQRLVSGLVLAPAVIALIYVGGWFFAGMVLIAAMIALYEFIGLADKGSSKYPHLAFGLVYLSICFGSFLFIYFGFEHGMWLVICLLLCVWSADTGAYMTGKTLKGPKMAPRLSPNKTWSGLAGSMVFCGFSLVLLLFAGKGLSPYLNSDLGLPHAAAVPIFAAGLLFGAVGQAGDLLISFYKRRVGAKDSGHLIPGHGGILDRIDALLLVSPFFMGMLILCL